MGRLPYDGTFFAGHQSGAARSAAVVVAILLRHFPARSVVDVGCGTGEWLAEFERQGITDCVGIDGEHVPRELLKISPEKFHAADLAHFTPPRRRFDLACSLEVAEHLPPACASDFVASLVALAPVVLFSAAIPGQGGTHHPNEQWQSYWAGLFSDHGYVGIDCIRPEVFNDPRVELWYRQNSLVFCEAARVPADLSPVRSPYELDRIDLELWRARNAQLKARGASFFRHPKAFIARAIRGKSD